MCLKAKPVPGQYELRDLFHHEQAYHKGVFIQLIRTSQRVMVGDIAGSINSYGYTEVGIRGVRYKLHRLAWIWHGRELIDGMVIDHIDGDPGNNRLDNLQQICQFKNLQKANYSNRRKGSTSQFGGVCWSKRQAKWHAQINIRAKQTHLGFFKSEIDAAKAYDAKVKELGGLQQLNFPDF